MLFYVLYILLATRVLLSICRPSRQAPDTHSGAVYIW